MFEDGEGDLRQRDVGVGYQVVIISNGIANGASTSGPGTVRFRDILWLAVGRT